MALSKSAANKKYDELRSQLKAGNISKEKFQASADRIYKMYHSKENAATRNAAPKPKAKPKAKPQAKPKPKQTSAEQAASRFYSSSSGTRGQSRPSNSPGPAVRRRGSTSGAAVDPRERSLRKNRQESKRGSTTTGKANIARQVAEQSGSSKRNQKSVEARRRRAREEAMKKNRREYLGNKYNR